MSNFLVRDQHWTIAPFPVDHPDAVGVLRRYFAEMVSRYYRRAAIDGEVDAALAEDPSHDLVPPSALFLLARHRNLARHRDDVAGCVGVRLLTSQVTELTRMYVEPAARRRGVGSRLLTAAEQAARDLGAHTMRLDTRHDLVEARALYAAHGYAEIPRYCDSPYADHWFEKRLT